jgi:hypothetical protein
MHDPYALIKKLKKAKADIPKEDIMLGLHEPAVRPYTGFAVA